MNNKLEVIGIDHGWSMMKTVYHMRSCIENTVQLRNAVFFWCTNAQKAGV